MTDAWMKRGAERQRLLEDLKRLILDEQQETHAARIPEFLLLGQFVAHFSRQEGFLLEYGARTEIGQSMKKLFVEHIEPRAATFSRTPEEKNSLLAELAEWVLQSVVRPYKQALLSQEVHEPERVFNGKRATDPV